MPEKEQHERNGLKTPVPDLEAFPTLRKSLSASFGGRRIASPKPMVEASLKHPSSLARSHDRDGFAGRPLSINIPTAHNPTDTALTALQYLPIPLLVLSSTKTVVLTNEAMGRLLGLDEPAHSGNAGVGKKAAEAPTVDLLRGQSLSQIGIELIQEGQQIWISWEVRAIPWTQLALYKHRTKVCPEILRESC